MSVQVENLEKNMAKLTIEVSAEDLEKALESAYQKQKKQISVPGFRKGKVPRAMIEKMYGVDVFYEDAANALMQQNYAAAVDESGIDIVSRPTVDVVQIEKGKPFIFTAEVAVKPEVTLGKYMGVTVTKIDTSVSDEEVDEALEKERNNNARTINVTDRPVAQGDTAVIDFEGFVDGVAFEEHSFLLGMEHFSNIIPQFDRSDAILSGMETRTSSPVRIMRDTNGESRVHGIYPGGEGAGYAGGIMSAAMDGLRLADDVMKRYHPVY